MNHNHANVRSLPSSPWGAWRGVALPPRQPLGKPRERFGSSFRLHRPVAIITLAGAILLLVICISNVWALPADAKSPQTSSGEIIPAQIVQSQAAGWQSEEVAFLPDLHNRGRRSLALDSQGVPHVVYGGNHLFHSWYSGGTWHQEVVDSSRATGSHASIALDNQDGPHIAYYASYEGNLMYSYELSGSGRYTVKVDVTGNVGLYPSIALDAHSRARIAYLHDSNHELRYAYDNGNTPGVDFSIDVVDTDVSWVGDLLLDANGRPHILYLNSNGGPRYAYYNGASWVILFMGVGLTDGKPSLALDTQGRPHIAIQYAGVYPDFIMSVHIYYYDGASWIEESNWGYSTSGYIKDQQLSMIIDAANDLHVSFYKPRQLSDCLAYIKNPGMHASPSCIQPTRNGYLPSLVVNASGQPRIVYTYGAETSALNLAYTAGACTPTCAWSTTTIAEEGADFQTASLVLDAYRPHIGYLQGDGSNVQYNVWYVGRTAGSWQKALVDSPGWDDGHFVFSLGMAIDPQGHPYLSYGDGTDGVLKYAYLEGGTIWPIDIADPNDVGYQISMAINAQGRPRLSYCVDATPSAQLRYAVYNGSGWDIEIVDDQGHPKETTLALDSAGHPHIVYGKNGGSINYAWHDGIQWHYQVIQSGLLGFEFGTLLINAQDDPAFSYSTDDELRYAYLDGAQWRTQIVDSGHSYGASSLTLYPNGGPAISYYDGTYADLKFANRICDFTSCTWFPQTVDNRGDVGKVSSIKVAPDVSVHIAYLDSTGRAFRYAHYDMPFNDVFLPLVRK